MSSPLGHGLVGSMIYTLAKKASFLPNNTIWLHIGFFLLASLPDLDFIPILLWNLPKDDFHRTYSHSLIFAVLVGILLASLYQLIFKRHLKHLFWLLPVVIATHGLMDACCLDLFPPCGVMYLWPFSKHYFYFNIPHVYSVGSFQAQGYYTLEALSRTFFWEIIDFGGLYGLILLLPWLWEQLKEWLLL